MAGGSYEDTMTSAPAAAKGAGYTVEEVAKTREETVMFWSVAHGRVLNVSTFQAQHLVMSWTS